MRAFVCWLGIVALCFAAALTGLVAPPGEWYASLEKPDWTPPSWLFGPVWTTLYILMGTAAWLVWRTGRQMGRMPRTTLTIFGVQLILNAAWTPIFFGAHWMLAALIWLGLLWCSIVATIVAFRRHSQPAALLLVPYLLWVTLATALNFELWRLNA